jgi:hypothetical protein
MDLIRIIKTILIKFKLLLQPTTMTK